VKAKLFGFGLLRKSIPQSIQAGGIGRGGRCPIFLLDLQIDLFAMDGDVTRRRDPEANLVAPDFDDCDLDIVTNFDTLV